MFLRYIIINNSFFLVEVSREVFFDEERQAFIRAYFQEMDKRMPVVFVHYSGRNILCSATALNIKNLCLITYRRALQEDFSGWNLSTRL